MPDVPEHHHDRTAPVESHDLTDRFARTTRHRRVPHVRTPPARTTRALAAHRHQRTDRHGQILHQQRQPTQRIDTRPVMRIGCRWLERSKMGFQSEHDDCVRCSGRLIRGRSQRLCRAERPPRCESVGFGWRHRSRPGPWRHRPPPVQPPECSPRTSPRRTDGSSTSSTCRACENLALNCGSAAASTSRSSG